MTPEEQNAVYIRQINENLKIFDKNLGILETNIALVNETVKNLARDQAAMQRAIIDYLREKEIINGEDDVKLLQKLHLRHIAALDKEIEAKKRNPVN